MPRTMARAPMIISSSLGTITVVAHDVIWTERKDRARQRQSNIIRLIESFMFPPTHHSVGAIRLAAVDTPLPKTRDESPSGAIEVSVCYSAPYARSWRELVLLLSMNA